MKRKIILLISIIIFFDIIIGISIFQVRTFPRLAMWNIIESNKQTDFYWEPKNTPKYFYFEPENQKLDIFRNEVLELIKDKGNDLEKILAIRDYVMNLGKNIKSTSGILSWGSPYSILKQLKEGKQGNCFHYSILFSTYLASIGIKSRLWALEGDDGLGRFGHTVVEVYIKNLYKWVMFDVTNNFYFKENNTPLSVLEFRDKLLNEETLDSALSFYKRLLKMAFLRTANDFVHKFDSQIRYGKLYKLQSLFDKFPSDIRRGLSYLLGRHDYLIHYVDRFDKSLKAKIIFAKTIFYFFVASTIFIIFLGLISIIKVLRNRYTHQRDL